MKSPKNSEQKCPIVNRKTAVILFKSNVGSRKKGHLQSNMKKLYEK